MTVQDKKKLELCRKPQVTAKTLIQMNKPWQQAWIYFSGVFNLFQECSTYKAAASIMAGRMGQSLGKDNLLVACWPSNIYSPSNIYMYCWQRRVHELHFDSQQFMFTSLCEWVIMYVITNFTSLVEWKGSLPSFSNILTATKLYI